MRYRSLVIASLLLAGTAFGQVPKAYQSGTLLQMDSVSCNVDKTKDSLCQEYLLQTDKTIYRIRPRHAKHPVLLPVGERAQFRLEKDKMLLRVETIDTKERDYIVVSTAPRGDSTADARPVRLNHLQ
jgi:hypothetical protein